MAVDYEKIIRAGYLAAEVLDLEKFTSIFTTNGALNDVSAGRIYRGKEELAYSVKLYAAAFPDMHRELHKVYVASDTVVVELSLVGTHKGPLVFPMGTLQATGKKMETPCCDVFRFKGDKIEVFNCYTAATAMLGQLGVLGNLGASLTPNA